MSTTCLPNAVPLVGLHIVAVFLQHKEKAIPQTSTARSLLGSIGGLP